MTYLYAPGTLFVSHEDGDFTLVIAVSKNSERYVLLNCEKAYVHVTLSIASWIHHGYNELVCQ
jgi:hypothetical protein